MLFRSHTLPEQEIAVRVLFWNRKWQCLCCVGTGNCCVCVVLEQEVAMFVLLEQEVPVVKLLEQEGQCLCWNRKYTLLHTHAHTLSTCM